MPCVEGELCHVPATSPKPAEAHGCEGGCGGRLHGTRGSIADDNEMHRICSHCLAKGEKRKATLLATATTFAAVREKHEDFMAGDKWANNFVKRNGLSSQRLNGETGSVNPVLIKKDIDEIKALCATFPARCIFNVDETGIQWEVMPRRTYLTNSENRKTVRGSKGMTFKDHLPAIMCCNADGTAKVDLAIIGKAKEPRCLRGAECPCTYFAQANAWSDTATFLKWWRKVFLPFVRRFTHEPVLLMMDGCSSHADLADDLKQVAVKTYPPGCTSIHQPMDQGIITKTKLIYGKELLDVKVSTMLVADTLRAQAKERKMKAGTAELAEGHHPHVRDAAELLKKAWTSVTA